ncbi:MAG TPA: ThuA domain-containing protein [Opitutus sp.]|nr:ThuA domain-containing protein [Opitutus sp.]
MNLHPKFLFLAASLLVAATVQAAPLRVLYFTKSSGFEHSVVKQADGKPSYSEGVLSKIAAANGLDFTFSKDGSRFSPEYLRAFDVVLFYTTGDLLSVGTDGHPAMTADGKQALLDWIAGGGGFVGVHSCSDTFHTGETGGGNPPQERRGGRFRNYGDAADPFVKCLGGEFIRHGPQQVATARVTSPAFPGFEKLGNELTVMEEWYSLKEFAENLHVQLVLQTKGMEGSDYRRPDFPIAWARLHGKGRVAYNAMGHREDVWDSAAFQSMLVGALKWAAGSVDADVTPNLEKVAPGHATLPPPPEPKK